MRYWLSLIFFVLSHLILKAQSTDSTSMELQRKFQQQLSDSLTLRFSDTTQDYKVGKRRDPNVAFVRALCIPGWGQIYNRKYWKLPIVYGLLGYSVYNVVKFQNSYSDFSESSLRAIKSSDQTDPFTGDPTSVAILKRDNAHRNRDYYAILSLAFYALQMVDAVVDAHLSDFNVNDNLSIHLFKSPPQLWANQSVYLPIQIQIRLN